MPKERTPAEVYEDFAAQGFYEEANLDRDEVEKIKMSEFSIQSMTGGKLCLLSPSIDGKF